MRDNTLEDRALKACKEGDLSTLKWVDLGPGGWAEVKDNKGATAVHHAARSGSVAVLDWLVKQQECPGNSRSNIGATPALDAAATGKIHALSWLLEHGGCDIKDADDSGATALHLAARYGHLETVKWLITTHDRDTSIKTRAGAMPLHFAASKGDLETVKFLVERNPGVVDSQMESGTTPTYLAAQEGHLETLRYLVEEGGSNARLTSFDGMSCLHAAAQMGKLDCVAWLIVMGKIGPNEPDFDGATPLHFAAGRGHAHVVEWLMLHGSVAVQDNLGGSPLHDAAENGQLKCVRTLVKLGCDPGLKDNNGMTAADLAENCWHRECAATIRRRLKKGVNGQLISSKKRPSLQSYFGDYVDMNGFRNNNNSDNEGNGGSDYVDFDSGSETSSTYIVHTDLSRSSIRSSDGEYQYYQFVGRLPGDRNAFPHLSIPPPPATPPPPIPKSSYGNHENADVTSLESNTSTSSQSDVPDYENLKPGEMESILQMQAAIKAASKGGASYGATPTNSPGLNPQNGHNPSLSYGNITYGNYILMQRNPRAGNVPNPPRTATLQRSNAISIPGNSRPALTRYNAISPSTQSQADNDAHAHRISATPKLRQISERESETGSIQASIDTPNYNGQPQSNPADMAVPSSQPEVTSTAAEAPPSDMAATPTAVSAPPAPAAPPVPPAPPPPPPGTFTPPTSSLRWKKMAYGSLPNVSMIAGGAAKFLLRPTLKDSANQPPNIDLISELKAANGAASLKKVKKKPREEEKKVQEEEEKEQEPKSFWKSLQRKNVSPPPPVESEGVNVGYPQNVQPASRRSSIQLRKDYEPEKFLDKVAERDGQGVDIPRWKRIILARQLAEKAQVEDDEKQKKWEEENKYKHIPIWKRALLEKKAREKQEKEKQEQETKEGGAEGPKKIITQEKKEQVKSSPRRAESPDAVKDPEETLAPWQLELKKKKGQAIFDDGMV